MNFDVGRTIYWRPLTVVEDAVVWLQVLHLCCHPSRRMLFISVADVTNKKIWYVSAQCQWLVLLFIITISDDIWLSSRSPHPALSVLHTPTRLCLCGTAPQVFVSVVLPHTSLSLWYCHIWLYVVLPHVTLCGTAPHVFVSAHVFSLPKIWPLLSAGHWFPVVHLWRHSQCGNLPRYSAHSLAWSSSCH